MGLLLALPAVAQETEPVAPSTDLAAPDAPAAAIATPAPAPAEATKAPEAPKAPSVEVGLWTRIGARLQGSTEPKKLNDVGMDTVYGELNFSGKVYDKVTATLDLEANGMAATAGILDAILAFDFSEPLHLWAGQLLVPVDRANSAGPFFMLPWNYPGVFVVGPNVVPATPNSGPFGRSAGAVLWGECNNGMVRYFGGVFSPGSAQSPLYSARVSVAAIGAEHGFWGNSTYGGSQDILAVGLGAQYQKNGSVAPGGVNAAGAPVPGATDNYAEVNADVFGEFKTGGSTYVTGEAAYYHFGGDYSLVKNEMYILGAYTTNKIGIGQIQPLVRYQWANNTGRTLSAIDVFVNYLIAGPALRLMFGFQHTDLDNGIVGNAVQLGVQGMLF
jgi:hypothetical protein